MQRLLRKGPDNEIRLETIIDVDKQIEGFRNNKLELINPNLLYGKNTIFSKSLLYQHYREESICVVNESDSEFLDLLNEQSYKKLAKEKLCRIHLGLIVIGIKGLRLRNKSLSLYLRY